MKRWVLLIVVLVITIFIIVARLILYHPGYANYPRMMELRNLYQNTYFNLRGMVDNQDKLPRYKAPYVLNAQPWADRYAYTFYGWFERFDVERGGIVLRGDDGKVYVFRLSAASARDVALPADHSYTPSQDTILLDGTPFTTESRVRIIWDDRRMMDEILDKYQRSPEEPLNSESERMFFFTKMGGEDLTNTE